MKHLSVFSKTVLLGALFLSFSGVVFADVPYVKKGENALFFGGSFSGGQDASSLRSVSGLWTGLTYTYLGEWDFSLAYSQTGFDNSSKGSVGLVSISSSYYPIRQTEQLPFDLGLFLGFGTGSWKFDTPVNAGVDVSSVLTAGISVDHRFVLDQTSSVIVGATVANSTAAQKINGSLSTEVVNSNSTALSIGADFLKELGDKWSWVSHAGYAVTSAPGSWTVGTGVVYKL